MSILTHFPRSTGGSRTPALTLEKVTSSTKSSRRASSSSSSSSASQARKRPLATSASTNQSERWGDDGDDDDYYDDGEDDHHRYNPRGRTGGAAASSCTTITGGSKSTSHYSTPSASMSPTRRDINSESPRPDLKQQALVAVTKVFHHEGFRNHQVLSRNKSPLHMSTWPSSQ